MRRYDAGTHEMTEPALKYDEMVGRAVAAMTESKVETTMQSERPAKTAMIFLKGRRLVWSVSVIASFE